MSVGDTSSDFRSFDAILPKDHVVKKTVRSHEENRERAYVAASRRSDRSLEARVKSARMASEIHKERTGKGFRITEELVLKEEMYEEEDDSLPSFCRLLEPTTLSQLKRPVETYLANEFAMSAMQARADKEWHQNVIDKLFARSFPNYSNGDRNSNDDNQSHEHNIMPAQLGQQLHRTDVFAQANQYYSQRQDKRGWSLSGAENYGSPVQDDFRRRLRAAKAHVQSVKNLDYCKSSFTPVELGSSKSAFPTDLPAEAKMLMGDVGTNTAFHQDYQNPFVACRAFSVSDQPRTNAEIEQDEQIVPRISNSFDKATMDCGPMAQSRVSLDEVWSTLIDDGVWDADQTPTE